ncbi:bacteriohopanetetrol glucosamine biosynthesis glycosyltransferase HpnI [Sediminicoccus sp. KRV36]|uniref:bacteriohopanetetrol glucosamine biosynthesis glycosyltransferase HpnI n=1 Tax=Sediminicoccus sp. KRV36 TaxID=3133721 RepID=UPI00200EBB25|nr:bacteriohopanetetrol glucosamine biosynthesis glycosyltransferase HpnI [Sediminicoccus rosea]UPY35112.1 bacteriohopanetetrol glucosamine biosynthesis glycosyltransferase HpnI [Sediminicoccus rosea]
MGFTRAILPRRGLPRDSATVTLYFAFLPILLALAGAVQALFARRALRALAGTPPPPVPALPASLLKPLHGAEPGLADNLAACLAQRHAAPFEVVFGAADPADAALPLAAAAMAPSSTPARIISGGALLGANRKVSQLVHLAAVAQHPALVISDADMRCPPTWLTAVTAPLADPAVGLVTCLYRGEPADDGLCSRLAALGIDWHFLPNAALGEALGQAQGCYGATMALRRDTLTQIGGFEPLLPLLADDHALGEAVRAAGLRVIVSPVIPAHVMSEKSFITLWQHELRWARTVRMLKPGGFLGLAFTHPVAWALLALALWPDALTLGVLGLTCAARLALAQGVDAALGVPGAWRRWAWLPLRDLLSAAIWAAALWPGSVVWGAHRYRLGADGRMVETTRTP